jgi:dTDP-4-amino-4,6-dideoxygalactose transaminase
MTPTEVKYVDFAEQYRQEKEALLPAIQRVFERGDFILGSAVEQFENEFAELCDVKYAIAVANGTDSLILAMRALNIGAGDEVITAPNSWISSASSIALVGAVPVFADVNEDQNISVEAVKKAITSKTKAFMPVHLTGRCADMTSLVALSQETGIPIIEDAAQSITAKIGAYTAGNGGLIGSFSLHPLKNLNAAGDAGILTTNDAKFATKLKLLRHHGLKNRDEVEFWGFNSRLDTLQAAILRTRLPKIKGIIEKRRKTAQKYSEALKNILQCPRENSGEFHTYHVYVIQTERRNELQKFLSDRGIETKVHYPIPIHLQKAASYLGYGPGSFPMVETQASRILSLPIHQYLKDEQIQWVIESIRDFFGC